MQVHIQFRGTQVDLPIAYRHTQQGLIYHALASDTAFASYLHDKGYTAQERFYKLFTFSPFSGAYTIQNKRIIFHDLLSMEVRSTDAYMIHRLKERFYEGSKGLLAGNPVEVVQCRITDEHLLMPEACIQTIAPIVVYRTDEDGKTRFFSPEEPEFCAGIVRNAQRKWQSLHGEDASFALQVNVIPGGKQRKVPTTFKGTFITGWNCSLQLNGLPEVLDMLYQTGLGAKNSQGFGLFRLIR